jgi:hypothetical protein
MKIRTLPVVVVSKETPRKSNHYVERKGIMTDYLVRVNEIGNIWKGVN